jgi:hypothetical protein
VRTGQKLNTLIGNKLQTECTVEETAYRKSWEGYGDGWREDRWPMIAWDLEAVRVNGPRKL